MLHDSSLGIYAGQPPSQATSSLLFVENVGQFDPRVRFQLRGDDAVLWVTDEALWITVFGSAATQPGHPQGTPELAALYSAPFSAMSSGSVTWGGVNVKVSFPGANARPRLEPFERQVTKVSYFAIPQKLLWAVD